MLFICFSKQAWAFQNETSPRGLEIDPISISDDDFNEYHNPNFPNKNQYINNGNSLNKNEVLQGTVGRSKFIRFDAPVKRISITNPDLADLVLLSPKEMLLNGKQAGSTSLIIWGDSEDPLFFELKVLNDTVSFMKEVEKISKGEKIDIAFNDSNAILKGKISSDSLKGKITNLAQAYGFEVVDLAESKINQVMLEVRVVEASKAFNTIIAHRFQQGSWGFIPSEISGASSDDTSTALVNELKNASFDGTMNGFLFYRNIPGSDLTTFFKAAQSKGIARVLAEPKILASNEKEASFNAGQQVPVPSGFSETGQVAYEYKDVGVNVTFKPTILENSKRIRMDITPEVSEIDASAGIQNADGSTVYGFKTRKVSTTVELGNGETLVIAGLYKRSNQNTRTQVPILGNIPLIGKLFNNQSTLKDETELMIFVTPKLLNKSEESKV